MTGVTAERVGDGWEVRDPNGTLMAQGKPGAWVAVLSEGNVPAPPHLAERLTSLVAGRD